MKRGSVAAWILFATFGLVLAAGVSIAASRLSSQRIALSSEPITAGRRLVPALPPARHTHRTKRQVHPRATARPVTPAPAVSAPPRKPSGLPTQAPTPPSRAPAVPAPQPKSAAPRHADDSHPEREVQAERDD